MCLVFGRGVYNVFSVDLATRTAAIGFISGMSEMTRAAELPQIANGSGVFTPS